MGALLWVLLSLAVFGGFLFFVGARRPLAHQHITETEPLQLNDACRFLIAI